MDWVIKFIKDLSGGLFYGKVILTFERGKVVRIEKQSSHKPPGN